MRRYEIMFIVVPNATDEELDKLIAQMEAVVKATQGEILNIERMGKRKLAYPISKFEEGYYVLFNIHGNGDLIREFERRLKVTDSVLRYLTVRVDEALKRVEKIKSNRLSKTQRKSPRAQSETTASTI